MPGMSIHQYHEVSGPGELHPEALAELYVSLSTHTAPITEPRRAPSAREQTTLESAARCGRSSGWLCADVGAASCIYARPKGQDRGSGHAQPGREPSDSIARNTGASPG